jgi:aminopeptidase N
MNNGDFMPQIGMSQDGFLQDRAKRRKYGLIPERRLPPLGDKAALERNYLGNADWVNSDITLATSAGQTPIAPGRKVEDRVEGGRRIAHFVSPQPILSFFSVQSAAYAEKSADADGVRLTVYHHPSHAYNVDTMLASMKTSLAYFRKNFGPYQFDYARIIEFPGYENFAQAFAGTKDPLTHCSSICVVAQLDIEPGGVLEHVAERSVFEAFDVGHGKNETGEWIKRSRHPNPDSVEVCACR